MRRTQLYLEDDLWNALHVRARQESTTISELVRAAVRERYFTKADERRSAMQAYVGIAKESLEALAATEVVRRLRRGDRLEKIARP
ncbi:MAG: ribbon-helix-helix protein, CopG family [Acidobacteria bacterium]|nr:ribbon-helix-helix protein, CopG family [Acidobacteriota bacterium]